MFVILFRRLARLACIAGLALAAATPLADMAAAATRQLSGTHSSGEIKAKCDANGGVFGSYGDGSYICSGTGGIVSCNSNGKCKGSCDKCASVAKGFGGILHPPASSGTTSAVHGSAPSGNKKPIDNVSRVSATGNGSRGAKH